MYAIERFTIPSKDVKFSTIKTTIVITMKSAVGRQAEILTDLLDNKPTSEIVVIYNMETEKPGVCNTCDDLLFTVKYALLQATSFPVLLLEDDARFSNFTSKDALQIESFIEEKKVDILSLGCVPILSLPLFFGPFFKIIAAGNTHSLIITRDGREIIEKIPFTGSPHDISLYWNSKSYATSSPRSVQKHTRTANSVTYDKFGVLYCLALIFKGDTNPHKFYKAMHLIGILGGVAPVLVVVCVYIFSMVL